MSFMIYWFVLHTSLQMNMENINVIRIQYLVLPAIRLVPNLPLKQSPEYWC